LEELRKKVLVILEDWDKWRLKHKKGGDQESERISEKERSSLGLYNAVSGEYGLPEGSENKRRVDDWVNDLSEDATFNFESYAECFISENLVRKYIYEKSISPAGVQGIIDRWRDKEICEKRAGNLSIDIRQSDDDLFYLSLEDLVGLAESPGDGYPDNLLTDEKQFTPVRNAVMHTSRLTVEAKRKLTAVYDNIKGRIKILLSR